MSNEQQYPYGQYDQHGNPQQPYAYDSHPDPGAPQGQGDGWAAQQPPLNADTAVPQGWDHQAYGAEQPPLNAADTAAPQGGDQAYGAAQPPAAPPADHHDASMTQTWVGQTWDTQYQPQVGWQPEQRTQPPAPYPPQARYAQQAAAADTAYLPPQGGAPLPPEVPRTAHAPHTAPASPDHVSVPYSRGQAQARTQAETSPPVLGGEAVGPATYSAPTTLGNTRITDAQRARAEGRSPIIAPGTQPAALTALLGLLLAGGAAIGPYALLVPLVLLQALTAAGWFRLNGMWPARQGIALAFAGGVVADVALLAVGKENAPAAIIGTLAVWVLLTLVPQLRSHAGADERMQGLMATLAAAALAILATGQLAAVPDAVVVGALAVAAATVVRALPLPSAASVTVALLAAAGAGAVGGGLTELGAKGALLGLGAGVCALIGLRAASYDYPSRFVHMTAGVALPLTAAVPAFYLLGRALA